MTAKYNPTKKMKEEIQREELAYVVRCGTASFKEYLQGTAHNLLLSSRIVNEYGLEDNFNDGEQ